jgi:cation diffusion facilitator CzcD-associated flavoprotein CzcO
MQTLQKYIVTVKVCTPRFRFEPRLNIADFYNRNQLSRFTKLEHRVRKAVWQEDTSQWAVEVENLSTGLVVEDQCDVLVNATGFLNKWTWPKIDGIGSFTKPKTHSAAWDHSLDYKDKTIGIIGTGSSAIQVSNTRVAGSSRTKPF